MRNHRLYSANDVLQSMASLYPERRWRHRSQEPGEPVSLDIYDDVDEPAPVIPVQRRSRLRTWIGEIFSGSKAA